MWASELGGDMTAIAILLLTLLATVPPVAWLGRRRLVDRGPIPWDLADLARRQITVLAGQAAVAVTAVVLLVTTLQRGSAPPNPAFETVLAMFLVAFLSFTGAAVQFALLPLEDRTEGSLLPRFLAEASGIQHYRTLFLAWLALKPLVDAFGLVDAGRLLEWLLGGAAFAGWLIVASLSHRMGFLSAAEAFVMPAAGVLLAVAGGILTTTVFAPGADPSGTITPGGGAEAALFLTVVIFGMNAVTFAAHALAPVVWRRGWASRRADVLARVYLLFDLQATVVVLSLIWVWLLRPY